jgi:predicted transcriptional regulator
VTVNWEKIARARLHPVQAKIIDKPAEAFDRPLANVSHHVRALRSAGIIMEVRAEPARGSVERFYVLA